MAWVPEGEKEQDSARQSAGNKEVSWGVVCPGPPRNLGFGK